MNEGHVRYIIGVTDSGHVGVSTELHPGPDGKNHLSDYTGCSPLCNIIIGTLEPAEARNIAQSLINAADLVEFGEEKPV